MAFKTVVKWFLAVAIAFGALRAAYPAEESLGTKIKKAFEPDPTPSSSRKHRKKKTTPAPKPTASPKSKKASPTPSPTPKSKSKRKKTSPTPTPGESPSATESPFASPGESPEGGGGKKGWHNVSLSRDAKEG